MAEERPFGFKVAVVVGSVFGAFLAVFLVLLLSRQAGAPAALAGEDAVPSAKAEAASEPVSPPTRIDFRDDLLFFGPAGEPKLAFFKLPNGGYYLFPASDAGKYHPDYGKEGPQIQLVSSVIIADDIKAYFVDNKEPARVASAPRRAPAPRPQASQSVQQTPVARVDPPAAPVARSVEIPAGTRLEVVLDRQLSTRTNNVGDSFPVSLTRAVDIDGQTILAEGTRLTGEITVLEKPGRASGIAQMTLVLKSAGGVPINTSPLTFEGEATKGQDAAKIGIGAGIGAAVGALFGGKKGAAKGTAVGAGGGTGVVLTTRGQDLILEPERALTFVLSRNAAVR